MLKKKQKPRGASAHKRKSSGDDRSTWAMLKERGYLLCVGFVAGVMTTVLCQFAVTHYASNNNSAVSVSTLPDSSSDIYLSGRGKEVSVEPKQPVFDFYTQLSQMVVNGVADASVNKAAVTSSTKDKTSRPNEVAATIAKAKKTSTSQSVSKTSLVKPDQKIESSSAKKEGVRVIYVVQAASLKDMSSASSLQKSMKTWGLESQIKQVSGKKNSLWYRVQSISFSTLQGAKDALGVLALHGVKGLILRQ